LEIKRFSKQKNDDRVDAVVFDLSVKRVIDPEYLKKLEEIDPRDYERVYLGNWVKQIEEEIEKRMLFGKPVVDSVLTSDCFVGVDKGGQPDKSCLLIIDDPFEDDLSVEEQRERKERIEEWYRTMGWGNSGL